MMAADKIGLFSATILVRPTYISPTRKKQIHVGEEPVFVSEEFMSMVSAIACEELKVRERVWRKMNVEILRACELSSMFWIH